MGVRIRQGSNIYLLRAAPLDAHIGGQIKARRTELGLTSKQLATALRLPDARIVAYEIGSQHIGPEELSQMAQTLGVNLAYFYAEPSFSP